MAHTFEATPGVSSYQLSNPPVLTMCSLYASLQVFDMTSMDALRLKALALTRCVTPPPSVRRCASTLASRSRHGESVRCVSALCG